MRPKAIIDWEEVNTLLMKGLSGAEIAGCIGLNKATIYDRCIKDNEIPFSEYSQQFYAKGDGMIRAVQYDKAMSGDNMMLIWLGKNRLKQRDKEETHVESHEEASKKLDALVDILKRSQSSNSNLKNEDNHNNNDS